MENGSSPTVWAKGSSTKRWRSGWGLSNSLCINGACPVPGGTAETRQAVSLRDTSVTFGLLPPDFCTLHAVAQMRQDSGYPDIYLHAGPDGSCSIPIVGKAKWLKPGSGWCKGCWVCWRWWAPD